MDIFIKIKGWLERKNKIKYIDILHKRLDTMPPQFKPDVWRK